MGNRKRVVSLMRQQHLVAKHRRQRRVRSTDSRHGLPIAPNRLDRDFSAQPPNEKWVADITYIDTGVVEVILAIQLRKEIEDEWLLVLDGILSVAFGILLATQPAIGLLAVLWMIGVYGIAYGVTLVVLAFRLRNFEVKDDARQTNFRQAHQS